MKPETNLKFSILFLAAFAFAGTTLVTVKADTATPATAQQAQIDQLKKTYKLETCPVSGDNLAKNDMGEKPIDYIYTQKNADGTVTQRLVRFCCKDCIAKFKRNPDKYLKIIDQASAK